MRFRSSDHGSGTGRSLGDEARLEAEGVLGRPVGGPVRLLTQIRRWGWLFNPISLYVLWDDPLEDPVAAIAEVTNTPWKERHRYVVALARTGSALLAEFDKTLHVSPFLDEAYRYTLRIVENDDHLAVDIDAHSLVDNELVVHTALRVRLTAPTRRALGVELWKHGWTTRQVSAGIHTQAARLMAKRVPFVSHPKRHPSATEPSS